MWQLFKYKKCVKKFDKIAKRRIKNQKNDEDILSENRIANRIIKDKEKVEAMKNDNDFEM